VTREFAMLKHYENAAQLLRADRTFGERLAAGTDWDSAKPRLPAFVA